MDSIPVHPSLGFLARGSKKLLCTIYHDCFSAANVDVVVVLTAVPTASNKRVLKPMLSGLAYERVFDRVDIHIREHCKRKLLSELSYGFLELFVEKLRDLIERNTTASTIHLRCQDGDAVQNIREATEWTCVVYPKVSSTLSIDALYCYCELVEDVWDSFFNLLSAHVREVAGCEVVLTNIECV